MQNLSVSSSLAGSENKRDSQETKPKVSLHISAKPDILLQYKLDLLIKKQQKTTMPHIPQIPAASRSCILSRLYNAVIIIIIIPKS
jgi:hypothetical protein